MKTRFQLFGTSLILLLTFFMNAPIQAQTITGVVTLASDGSPLPGVSVLEKGTTNATQTDFEGRYSLKLSSANATLVFSFIGCVTREVQVQGRSTLNVVLEEDANTLEEVVAVANGKNSNIPVMEQLKSPPPPPPGSPEVISIVDIAEAEETVIEVVADEIQVEYDVNVGYMDREKFNTEGYATIHENDFKDVMINPLSTFSVDVDRASYSNIRRMINDGYLPHKDVVRIEEMINYFNYDYRQPENEHPFSINTELSACPWNKENLLLHIGLQGREIDMEDLPPSNIVFLIDVSGSMDQPNKLPLLKSSFRLLLETLRPQDRVAMVVYAGNSGLVLPSTPCTEKHTILNALEMLRAGGSTAGGEGLKLAYQVAEENFIQEGNNRIILATDGDFNVGPSSNAEMERLVEANRDKGIFISVLGYGMGNYKDDKAEIIADKGNGNYAYIDNLLEAKKVLVSEFGGTLFTIAKDVKLQLEFNPAEVAGYRLIGYENRLLNEEDFHDDTKDAGEIGSGHTVTALYEIIPSNRNTDKNNLKYQRTALTDKALNSNDLLTLNLRYKQPDREKSILLTEVVKNTPGNFSSSSDNFRFSAAVAEFGMLLRESKYLNGVTWAEAIDLAGSARGNDPEGYRAEMIRLMASASLLRSNSGGSR